ncbi:plasmid mobilization relaxosome protein MobC [Neoaquamicrobium sediminum]|uniref:plasmid mobilization relaxosome protein MobC n=1 Tax=Neoaquamicrobium sediminum TaxID=1849104 RepID=UPI003BA8C067
MDQITNTASPAGKPRTRPFSIRLTDAEKAILLRRAGNRSLGVYVRGLAEGELAFRPRQRRSKAPIKDHEALARVLAALGQSRVANNLNQIAKAVNIGVLPVTPETEQDICDACSAVAAMRRHLISALGLTGGSSR